MIAASRVWTDWSFEPGVILPAAAAAVLYMRGTRATPTSSQERLLFWSGFACLAIALISPVDALGEKLFSAHMLQHEILMLAAAPLLVLARPAVPMLFALPMPARRGIGRVLKLGAVQAIWRTLRHPVSAWSIHAAAIWCWHAPALFDATLESPWIHAAQHLSFFGSAALFWWSLFEGKRGAAYGMGVLSVFSTAVHTSILGALLTFSRTPWYLPYVRTAPEMGWTPLEDQQAGGLIMWVPAGVVYVAAGLLLLALCLRASDTGSAAGEYAK